MIKNRDKHYEKCQSFVRFKCYAPVCRINQANDCQKTCQKCKEHDCFSLAKLQWNEDEDDRDRQQFPEDKEVNHCKPCEDCMLPCPQKGVGKHICGTLKTEETEANGTYHEDCTWGTKAKLCIVDHSKNTKCQKMNQKVEAGEFDECDEKAQGKECEHDCGAKNIEG